jgi:hypothetical protein
MERMPPTSRQVPKRSAFRWMVVAAVWAAVVPDFEAGGNRKACHSASHPGRPMNVDRGHHAGNGAAVAHGE